MEKDQTGSVWLTRAVNSTENVVTAVFFVGAVWLALHIVLDRDGPAVVYRYVHGHLTNFVDPVVRGSVSEISKGNFLYSYTISNGPWGFQDIREVGFQTGPGRSIRKMRNWREETVHYGLGQTIELWRAIPTGENENSISRGGRQTGFTVQSRILPAIVQVHAGHDLRYESWGGLLTDISTPAGGRVIRWTVGPRRLPKPLSTHALLGELVPSIYGAAELGWIDHELAGALARTLNAAAVNVKTGKTEAAMARLERLLEIVEVNAGLLVNEEAYALIAFNVEYALGELRTQLFVAQAGDGLGECSGKSLVTDCEKGDQHNCESGKQEDVRVASDIVRESSNPPLRHEYSQLDGNQECDQDVNQKST